MLLTNIIYRAGIAIWSISPFRRHLAILLNRTHFPVGKLWIDLWFEGSFNVQYAGKSFRLIGSREDKGALEIFWKGLDKSWDAQSIKVWGDLAKNSRVIFDIGANIGLYSIVAKTVNPQCKVYAFEPSRKTVEKLKQNITANNYDINVVPIALSNTIGYVDFYDLNTFTAVASLKPNESLITNSESITYKVPVTTLKQYVEESNISQIDLISIDTEMNEPEVLEGMDDLIQKFKPNFIIEVLNNKIGAEIEKYFHNMDYLFFSIDEKTGLSKLQHVKRESTNEDTTKSFNFLICSSTSARSLGLI